MTDDIHLRHGWQRQLGPFYDIDELAAQMQIDASAVADLVRNREVLQVRDDNQRPLHPTFALSSLVSCSDVKRVLDALTRSCDEPWVWALWLSGALPKHGGRCAIDDIAGGSIENVLERARNEDWECLVVPAWDGTESGERE
ncbi:hypothetical protein [Kitasatospora herbaricolor]|uniref:hypothetical protein n=1 Tax=Kitasatospora herbaricolor TaxID=68217 RepID=UPI0036DA90EB